MLSGVDGPRRTVVAGPKIGYLEAIEVMPVDEHEEEIDHYRRSVAMGQEAWNAAEDECERLRAVEKAARGVVSAWGHFREMPRAMDHLCAALAGLRSTLLKTRE